MKTSFLLVSQQDKYAITYQLSNALTKAAKWTINIHNDKSIDVDFQVTRSGSEIHVHVWLILAIQPTGDAPYILPHSYVVQEAQSNCLLLSYAHPANGEKSCMLWGLKRDDVNKDTECYRKILSACPDDMEDITESKYNDPCEQTDEDERKGEELRMKEIHEAMKSDQ
ncbi:hypothetical protein MRX96_023463 [Rhipicephalus microplus]